MLYLRIVAGSLFVLYFLFKVILKSLIKKWENINKNLKESKLTETICAPVRVFLRVFIGCVCFVIGKMFELFHYPLAIPFLCLYRYLLGNGEDYNLPKWFMDKVVEELKRDESGIALLSLRLGLGKYNCWWLGKNVLISDRFDWDFNPNIGWKALNVPFAWLTWIIGMPICVLVGPFVQWTIISFPGAFAISHKFWIVIGGTEFMSYGIYSV